MKNELEKFIKSNREQFDNKTPDPVVLERILQQMQAGTAVKPKGILVPFRVVWLAAASVVLVALGISFWALTKRPEAIAIVKTKTPAAGNIKNAAVETEKSAPATEIVKNKSTKPKSIDSVDEDLALRKHVLLAKLKEKALREEKHVMFAGLNNMDSPAARITAASEATGLKNTGNDIVDALVTTLNNDPSANVRLAALDGLARFYRETYVRKKLITSLKKQQDPIVQIALINLLTRMKESGILAELNKLVNDENTQKPVKDCAYLGIIQLRSS